MEDRIIYCKLTEKSSRKVWVIEPKQFYPDKTEIYPLSVSLASTVIDRIEHPIGCVIGLYSSKLTLASTKKYYSYSGEKCAEVYDDPISGPGYQRYIRNRDKTPEEIAAEEAKISKTLLSHLLRDTQTKPLTIEQHGFYIEDDKYYLLVRNIKKVVNTLLLGPTGSGKTEVIALVAKQLGLECEYYDMGAMADPIADLLGVHRLENGNSIFDFAKFCDDIQKPKIIILDELSRMPHTCANIIYPLLDNRRYLPVEIAGSKDVRRIPVHPKCVFFATANIGIEYTGTSTMDKALTNRFFPIELDYLNASNETSVLVKRCGIAKSDAKIISNLAESIRKMKRNSDLETAISTRETLMIADLIYDGWELVNAVKAVLLPLYEQDDREKIIKLIMSK